MQLTAKRKKFFWKHRREAFYRSAETFPYYINSFLAASRTHQPSMLSVRNVSPFKHVKKHSNMLPNYYGNQKHAYSMV